MGIVLFVIQNQKELDKQNATKEKAMLECKKSP